MAITVIVADDSLIIREGVRELLTSADDIEVVASCADTATLVAAVEEHDPDVVVTDIRMPPSQTDEGIQVAAALHDSHPSVGVVVVSQYSEPGYAVKLLERGSDRRAYLLKERILHRGELANAIRAVAAGQSMIDPKVIETLVVARSRADQSPLSELTAREREVLAEIAQGKSNSGIAESLFLTKRGVEKHIGAIFLKLGLSSSDNVSKRVTATLMFLAEDDGASLGRVGEREPR